MNTSTFAGRPRKSDKSGFSLAELMVVIVIIGLLMAFVVPNLMSKFGFAQSSKALVDIKQLESALTEYAIRNGGVYPESLEALVTPDENGNSYLGQRSVPKDPWNNEYMYEAPVSGDPRPRVFSYGRDGSPGGQGDDADLDSRGDEE